MVFGSGVIGDISLNQGSATSLQIKGMTSPPINTVAVRRAWARGWVGAETAAWGGLRWASGAPSTQIVAVMQVAVLPQRA